jgi:tRNA A37 threonylcarbamoyladenosine dehydratase
MTNWTALVAVAAVSVACTVTVMRLGRSTPAKKKQVDDAELLQEQLARNRSFLGDEAMRHVSDAYVVVVGLGGVGSWAATMLLRSGVTRLKLIDFDQVTLSSLNRHAVATRADVGLSKAQVLKDHLLRVCPSAQIEVCVEMFSQEAAEHLLGGNPDWVLDCIDNIDTKVALLKWCHDHKINVMGAMGAGGKCDPSRIQIGDISETMEDHLARSVRRRLKLLGIERGVPVVFSTEKPNTVKLLPLEESKVHDADEYAILPEFRSRIMPVLGPLPAIFGMAMATYVVCKLAEFPIQPLPIKLRSHDTYVRIRRDAIVRDMNVFNCPDTQALSESDVCYLVEEVFYSRSVVSGFSADRRMALARWDTSKPLDFGNLVYMTKDETKAHYAKGMSQYSAEIVERVNTILQAQIDYQQARWS